MSPVTSDDLVRARKTWRTVEPYHGMVYFASEAAERYASLGLVGPAGYFASRAASMGAVNDSVVTATFYNFNPSLVASAIPGAWDFAPPEQIIEARFAAVDAALRRLVPEVPGSPEVARAAALARSAAEVAVEKREGRPLFAAHAALDWPSDDHVVLWHAQSLLREYRGDGHIAALVLEGLTGLQSLVVHAASGEVTGEVLRTTRGWSEVEWSGAVEALQAEGWLDAGPTLALSGEGNRRRQRVEDLTDRSACVPYQKLGDDRCAELRQLVRPWSRAISSQLFR